MQLIQSLITLVLLAIAYAGTASARPLSPRQAPNPSYVHHPFSQTASYNLTAFMLPIKKNVASHLSGGRKLLTPQGIPEGMLKSDEHPVLYVTGLLYDIRQGPLQIQQLQSANMYIPFVDELNDGQTPFTFNLINFQDQLVPVIAGALQQSINLQPANFNPADKAWRALDANLFAQDINQGLPKETNILGAPVPGRPGITAVWSAVDGHTARIGEQFFKGAMSAPYIHTYSGLCSKTTYDYDQAFAQPFFVKGDVTAYPPALPDATQLKGVSGFHIATGWDNEFGIGHQCKDYKDFAASIKYH